MKSEKELIIHAGLPGNKSNRPSYIFKIVIVGEAGVGKSSLFNRATSDNSHEPFSIFEFSWKNYTVEGEECRIQIWDTCGQELYHSVIKNFYRNAGLAYLVFSLDNVSSFLEAKTWLNEIKDTVGNIIIFLIGNKCDTAKRKVTKEQIEEFKQEHSIEYYIETSAKTGLNTDKLFEDTMRKLYYIGVILADNDKDSTYDCSSKNNIVLGRNPADEDESRNNSCRICWC